ncbi:MAG: hypothetical protein FGM35_05055 [Rhodocyclaceae bacterium]|nr:hypothetical protein [Rhodocyclaceae bacterium]
MDAETSFAAAVDRAIDIANVDYKIKFSKLRQMINQYGHVEAARKLISVTKPSDGFTDLVLVNRRDLSLENIALMDEHRELFSEEQLAIASKKLAL